MTLQLIAALVLVLLALLHSSLGEKDILRPLLAQSWQTDLPRPAMDHLLRFAWHLTSIAWIGLAAMLCGAGVLGSIAWACAASALLVFVMLRGHLAWPLFALVTGLLWEASDAWPGDDLPKYALVSTSVLVAGAAGILHVYWALGGRWGYQAALPIDPHRAPRWSPGASACMLVAGALFFWAALITWTSSGAEPSWVRICTWGSVLCLTLRAIGEGRLVGFSKQERSTTFGKMDDRLYTPLVVLLLAGALSALSMT